MRRDQVNTNSRPAGMAAQGRLFRENHHFDLHAVELTGKVCFEATRVSDPAFRIIHEAKQSSALGVFLVVLAIGQELLGDLFGPEPVPGPPHLDQDPFLMEQEVRPPRAARVMRRPLLRSDVVELEAEKGMDHVQRIILILHFERRAAFASLPELPSDGMKAGTNLSDQVQRSLVPVLGLGRPGGPVP